MDKVEEICEWLTQIIKKRFPSAFYIDFGEKYDNSKIVSFCVGKKDFDLNIEKVFKINGIVFELYQMSKDHYVDSTYSKYYQFIVDHPSLLEMKINTLLYEND